MRVKEILKVTGGKLLSGRSDADIDLSRVSTDTRTIGKGDFFIALGGPNFDGNQFVRDAFKKGAVGAIISGYGDRKPWAGKIIIDVNNTTKALQEIASSHRKKFKIPVIATTGSNGKTTVKEMLSSVLSTRYNVLKNEGTQNNHIGVPATLLKLKNSHDLCILELGTNHKGEIGRLGFIAKPDIAVITNIGPSHLEFLGDLNGVYKAKTEILEFLEKARGFLVINGDDKYLSKIKNRKLRILKYGFKRSNDFYARAIVSGKASQAFVVNNKMVFELNLCGVHNILNALAAIAVGGHFGISHKLMREELFHYKPASMRMDIKKIDGVDIIDDSYNSNPLSMSSALEALKNYPAKSRWVVSADMLELGRHAVRFHKMVGDKIAHLGINGLLTFGDMSRHTLTQAFLSGMPKKRLWHCSDRAEIAEKLKSIVSSGDAVLLKGSRGMKMEEVLQHFKS